jgi:hypothetical protein
VIFDIVLNHVGDVFAYDGNPTAPFSSTPMPVQWRDATGTAQAQWSDVAAIENPPPNAVVWPSELQWPVVRFYHSKSRRFIFQIFSAAQQTEQHKTWTAFRGLRRRTVDG